MDLDQTWAAITHERHTLADLLDDLDAATWETPSLCTHWRVRDVAAHVALVPNPPGALAMGLDLLRARGSFDRLNRDLTIRRAEQVHPGDIVADLRERAGSRRVPVVTNSSNVLFDILVHGQDIAVPLGITRRMPLEAARAGADRVWTMGWPFHARRRMRGLRLVATDADWAVGEGVTVTGPVQAHLLALTGRPAALRELDGEGAGVLAQRLGAASDTPRA